MKVGQLLSLSVRKKRKGGPGQGLSVTHAGAPHVPVGEVLAGQLKPGSGHGASVSNFQGQILSDGALTSSRAKITKATEPSDVGVEQSSQDNQSVQDEESSRGVSHRDTETEGQSARATSVSEERIEENLRLKKRKLSHRSGVSAAPAALSAELDDVETDDADVAHPLVSTPPASPHAVPSPVRTNEPVRVDESFQTDLPGSESGRVESVRVDGQSLSSSSIQRKIDELLEQSFRQGDLREWQECDLPGGVRNLYDEVVQTVRDFSKDAASSSTAFPVPTTQANIPEEPEDDPETAKFSSPRRCADKLFAGVDQNDFYAAQAESDLLGAALSIKKLKNEMGAKLCVASLEIEKAQRIASKLHKALSKVKYYHYEILSKSRKLAEFTSLYEQAMKALGEAEQQITLLKNENQDLTTQVSQDIDEVSAVKREIDQMKISIDALKIEKEHLQAENSDLAKDLVVIRPRVELCEQRLAVLTQGLVEKDVEVVMANDENAGSRLAVRTLEDRLRNQDEQLVLKDREIEELKKEIEQLRPLTDPRLHIKNWVKQEAYRNAAAFTQSFAGPQTGEDLRKAVLSVHPDFDLNRLRVFPTERIRKDGSTMVRPPTTLPPVYLDSDNLSPEQVRRLMASTIAKNLKYDSPNPQPDEVYLPAECYKEFEEEHETYLYYEEKIRLCQEQGVEYQSSDDEAAGQVDAGQTSGGRA